jgi:hypothetical protein
MINENRMQISASRDWNSFDEIALRIGRVINGSLHIADPIMFRDVPIGTRIEPCVELTSDAAQTLMDELWNIGVRPTEGHGSTGQIAATEKHLDDMRQLLFHKEGFSPVVKGKM